MKLFLLGGDIEVNPGMTDENTDQEHNELLATIGAVSDNQDSRHDEVMSVLTDLRPNQEALAQRVSDLAMRLAMVESAIENIESAPSAADIPQIVNEAIKSESLALTSRLSELEDRSRRDNLLFYGISDNQQETWEDSEKLICDLLSRHFQIQLKGDEIDRAHRLGPFVRNKARPIIVKFASFKTKGGILAQKAKLKGSNISIGEDFCRETRHSRKKLLEFAKASGQAYSLRFNKLTIDKKVYTYCAATDTVCEIESPRTAPVADNNIPSSSPVRPGPS